MFVKYEKVWKEKGLLQITAYHCKRTIYLEIL